MSKYLFVSVLFIWISTEASAQRDSIYRRHLSISLGYKDYSSVNEIFNPFIYTATSAMFSAEYKRFYKRSKIVYSIDYAHFNRHPKDLPIPPYYELIGKENGSVYRVYENLDEERNLRTNYFHLFVGYSKKIATHLLTSDALSLGLSSDNVFILTPRISYPEMIALTINPTLGYELHLKHGFSLSFDNQLSLLALTIQRPYCGAEAQLDEETNFHTYVNYVLQKSKLNSIGRYFQFSSQLTMEKEISNRILLTARYSIRFQEMKKTKRFESAETAMNVGIVFKFR